MNDRDEVFCCGDLEHYPGDLTWINKKLEEFVNKLKNNNTKNIKFHLWGAGIIGIKALVNNMSAFTSIDLSYGGSMEVN